MAEPYYDAEGNQVFGGKGRRSKRVGELAKANGLYHMINDELVHVLTDEWGYPLVDSSGNSATTDDIQKEIEAYLSDIRKNQERDNCRACKSWSIPQEKWPNTKHGKCSKHDEDMLATQICKFFARPGKQSESEWWDSLSKKEKDKIIKSHKKIRARFVKTLDKLIEYGDKNSSISQLQAYKKKAKSMNINFLQSAEKALSHRLSRFDKEKDIPREERIKIQNALRKRKYKEHLELAASKWSDHGVKLVKGKLALGKVKKTTASGMASHLKSLGLDPKYGFKKSKGWVFK